MLMGWIGVSPIAHAASDAATLTVGAHLTCFKSAGQMSTLYGYFSGSFGSYSPSGLTGGKTAIEIWDSFFFGSQCGTEHNSVLVISGFSVDPGQDWVTSITCNGVTNDGSGASSYTYTSSTGSALWTWSQLFGLMGKSSVSCTINHN